MKPLFPRPNFFTISLFTNTVTTTKPCCQIAHFSTNFQTQVQSTYPSRRHEEESRNVKVSVWWDFENCSPPAGVNVFKIAQCVTAAIRANGIKGPIQITAFGDVMQLSRVNQEALSSTGINLAHIPHGGKNSADRSLLVDLMYWVSQNPPPAHLFLISGDRDFAGILHRLRMSNYNILLASPESAPSVLCSAASIMWQWNALLKGENLIGKHFNQPPDGPYGSWYGHYKAALEDPFAVTEQPANPRSEELSEAVADSKCRPIPRSIVRHIRNILNSYPKGVSITELRAELTKSNLSIDKDFYGHKKFSRFLLAMPNILKVQFGSDGKYLVRSVNPKVPEQSDNSGKSAEPETNGEAEFTSTPILNGETGSCMEGKDEKSPQSSEQKVKTSPRKFPGSQRVQEVSAEVQQPPPENVVAKASEGQLQTAEQHDSAPEMDFLKRFWNMWFGNKEYAPRDNISNESKTAERDVELKSHSEQSEGPPSFAPGNNTNTKDKAPMHPEDATEKPSQESGFTQPKHTYQMDQHGNQMNENHDSTSTKDWDPSNLLNNLSFLEQKIHQLQELVHLIVGRRGQTGLQGNDLIVQQQQLITADLTSIIVQLVSTAGSLLPTMKHSLSSVSHAASQLVQFGGVTVPSATCTNGGGLPCNDGGVTKVEDQSNHVDQLRDCGIEQSHAVDGHESKDEDEAEEEENLPPGSYEILQLEKEEILAPHTHFCTICGKGFKRDANLRMHMRGHGDEYKTPAALAKPHKEPSSEPTLIKRYSCPNVGCKRNKEHKKFQPLKTILCVKNHYKRTHCEKAYTCSRCNIKKFSVIADLKTHEKHCGKDKWLCSCGTTFSRKDKLFGHIALFQGHTPAVPLDETKGSAGTSDRGQTSEVTMKARQEDFKVNASHGNEFQDPRDIKSAADDPGSYFSPLNFDTSNLNGFQEFPRPPFDESDSSFSFLLSGSCEYPPHKAAKYMSSTELE